MLRSRSAWAGLALFAVLAARPAIVAGANETYEVIEKGSIALLDLQQSLRPFVATCEREKTHFRRLFCTALNERLKAQHQSKLYRYQVEPSEEGPLIVRYRAKPAPVMELVVRGCLTCKEPLLSRAGGDVAKGRFFVFKTPSNINVRRGGKALYDLGDITVETFKVELPKDMTEEKWKVEVLPHLRLDLLYRPVAGVTMVGKRFKYGVITFELAAHRVVHKCNAAIYGASPKMAGLFRVDRNDLSCPQNQPRVATKRVRLPTRMPQAQVKALMDGVGADLYACYNQFGASGDVPADIVVAPTGKVKVVKVAGPLAGTPTARCVERLVKHLVFPRFAGDDARLQWPFSIRP